MDALIDMSAVLFLGVLTVYVGNLALVYNRRSAWARRSHKLSQDYLRAEIDLIADRRRIEREKSDLSWNGFRKFEISNKVMEAAGTCSFYLAPHDGKSLPPFEPGQFLTFNLNIPGQAKSVVRCYSLSDSPNHPESYRVTIKRVPPPRDRPELPPGLSSNFFLDQLNVGDIVDVKAPSGHFFLDMSSHKPIVLIGGGVGLTPVLSMLNAVVESGSQRETHFFYGVVCGADHAFKEHLQKIARENENIHLHVCYSHPTDDDVEGEDYQHGERVSVDLFRRLLASNNYEFYLCGPPPMMNALVEGLEAWKVPEKYVHFEAFGPASVKKKLDGAIQEAASDGPALNVKFARSDKSVSWNPEAGSILELAEANGVVNISASCRTGNCGSCITAIKEGEVEYLNPPGSPAEDGSCYTCISVPKSDLVIDA
jgi:hypothetical protein